MTIKMNNDPAWLEKFVERDYQGPVSAGGCVARAMEQRQEASSGLDVEAILASQPVLAVRDNVRVAAGAFEELAGSPERRDEPLIVPATRRAAGSLAPRALQWSRPLEDLRQEMEELVSRAFGEAMDRPSVGRFTAPLDLAETDSAFELRMDIPGAEAKDIDIQVNANVLTVSGERKEERAEQGKTYHRVERRVGTFSRSITLPCPIKEDAVDAQYRNGILTIRLPKTEEARTRKIAVKA